MQETLDVTQEEKKHAHSVEAPSNLLTAQPWPNISPINDRFGEMSRVAPAISLFKSFIDPLVVLLSLFALCAPFHIALDGYMVVLGAMVFLLSIQFLDGTFLFVPGESRPLLGIGQFLLSWAAIAIMLVLLGSVSGFDVFYDSQQILTWFALAPVLLLLIHLACRIFFGQHLFADKHLRKAVIVGANAAGAMLAQSIKNNSMHKLSFAGYFDDRAAERLNNVPGDEILGCIKKLPAYVKEYGVHNIYVSLPMTSQPRVMQLLDELKDSTVSVYFVPDFFVFDLIQARFDHIGGIPVVAVCESPFTGINGFVKRISDIVFSLLIMALIWPVMLAVALAVKLTSPGPVLFKQRRYGADGESILVYKFRSMVVMEDGGEIRQATQNDKRLTPIGAFIRKTSLDELPQFINVLQGRMSIVGPRPHANAHNELYRKLIKGYMIRHKVKPGITGWAQVSGYRGETDTLEKMEKRIEHDLDYLRNWSIWLDIKIIARTATQVIIRDKNAY